MENNDNSKQDCGCEGDCCTPKKKPGWVKIISILVILTALGLIVIKKFFM
jgi:hypothetical protein